jgi:HEAT repeat protein
VAATTQLTRAALALIFVLAAQSAQPRSVGRADSILAALESTDAALFGRVLGTQTRDDTQRAEVRVLETLRGVPLPERIHVLAGPEALLEGDAHLEAGETVLLLVARTGDQFRLPAGLRQAKVIVEGTSQQDAALALLRGYLDGLSGVAGPSAFDALLRRSVAIESPRLRAGVLEDLSHRLGGYDAPFLLGLAEQSDALQDVRLFAIRGLAGLTAPLPAALAELLRPAEPVAIRQAVINAYAAHGVRETVERGLADPSEEVRRTSVENLAAPEAVAALESHFAREPALGVRVAVVKQLGLIGTEEARSAMRRILASTPDAAIHRAGEPWLEAAGRAD